MNINYNIFSFEKLDLSWGLFTGITIATLACAAFLEAAWLASTTFTSFLGKWEHNGQTDPDGGDISGTGEDTIISKLNGSDSNVNASKSKLRDECDALECDKAASSARDE